MIYYSCSHSIMTYRLIFCGNSYYSNSIFRLQKGTIRLIVGIRDRDSRREHFRKLRILPLKPQYILSLPLFVIDNINHFKINCEIRNINTRTKCNLHQPLPHLSTYQKETYCFGIEVFNNLPTQIKDLSHDTKQFKSALKSFFHVHSFYTLDEYFNYVKN
jgi:hypothetical protein